MPKAGRRYPLLVYTRMLDYWSPALFFIGLGLLACAWPFYQDPYSRLTQPWRWMTLGALGGVVVFVSLLMVLFRKSAFARPFRDYLLVATPFLRLKISYRRIQRITPAGMATLFPPRKLPWIQRSAIEPLLSRTALVLSLTGMPMSATTLRLFLSRFFFKDKTPHIVILVDKWMDFSNDLESWRVHPATPPPVRPVTPSILTKLPPR
jgi:hypothetical protein